MAAGLAQQALTCNLLAEEVKQLESIAIDQLLQGCTSAAHAAAESHASLERTAARQDDWLQRADARLDEQADLGWISGGI